MALTRTLLVRGTPALALIAVAALALAPVAQAAPRTLVYRVTITNLSRADLTPAVYAVHDRRANLFRVGRRAAPGLALLAEDGATARAAAEFRARRGVRRVNISPRIAPRRSITLRLRTTTAHRRFSFASMAVCSNDSFAGLNNIALPTHGRRRVIGVRAYDAGSERNTESAAHVPCLGAHGVGPSERRAIRVHPRLRGHGDLSNARHGWGRYIAKVVVRRVR